MKNTTLVLAALAALAGLTSACLDKFTACTTNARNAAASCTVSDSGPDYEYYLCLCKSYDAELPCYNLCPEIPDIGSQVARIMQTRGEQCKAADDFARAGKNNLRTTATTAEEPTAAPQATVVNGKTLTKMPTPTKRPFGGNNAFGAPASGAAATSGDLLGVTLVVGAFGAALAAMM